MGLLNALLLIALIVFISLLCWLLLILIGVIRRAQRPPAQRPPAPMMERRLRRVRELSPEDSAYLAPADEVDPLAAPRRPHRLLLDGAPVTRMPAPPRPAEPQPQRWVFDPIFESEPEDRGLPVPLERLLALMLEGRKLERRPYTYGLDEWLLLPIRPDLEGFMQVRVADAERAARHPSVVDASESFNQPVGTSYLHRDTVPLLLIWARWQADAATERRRRELEGDR